MNHAIFENQLDQILEEFSNLQKKSRHSDLSDLSSLETHAIFTRAVSAVHRITGKNSIYSKEIERLVNHNKHLYLFVLPALGVVRALRDDIRNGYLYSLTEIVHSDIFSDYLEMAEHLSSAKYKDAAAVIAGSTLESHLRSLCAKFDVDINLIKPSGEAVAKKAEALNSDLASCAAYSKLDQKSVTAWLGLRNNAAHGKYDEYSQMQVDMLIAGVRDFIIRHPA